MKTVTLDVRAPAETMKDLVRVWKTGKAEKSARISFASPELLWKVLTAKRELLKALCGAGPVSIREALHSSVIPRLGNASRLPGVRASRRLFDTHRAAG